MSDFDQELPDWDLLRRSDVVVRSSGSLAHLYFNVTSKQMDVSEIASLYADLMVKLTTHAGIWLVVGREGEQVIIASARGILTLDQQQIVEGENPLGILPEPEIAAAQLRRLAHFPHSGDLILLGEYAPKTEEVVCFEQQWACHGGLGGPQDYPFMICPSEIEMDLEDVTNSEQLHDHFVCTYLREELVPSELEPEQSDLALI